MSDAEQELLKSLSSQQQALHKLRELRRSEDQRESRQRRRQDAALADRRTALIAAATLLGPGHSEAEAQEMAEKMLPWLKAKSAPPE